VVKYQNILGTGLNYGSNANNWSHGHLIVFEFNPPLLQDPDGI